MVQVLDTLKQTQVFPTLGDEMKILFEQRRPIVFCTVEYSYMLRC